MDDTSLSFTVAAGLLDVSPADWNTLANPQGERFDPFLSWEFLEAMESSGAATAQTGWLPQHILIHAAGRLAAAMPLYVKSHSRGEFVFDQGWADAFERAGGAYYPKLLSAVPFTPVTGRRLLVAPGPDADRLKRALYSAAVQLAEDANLSSFHLNFIDEPTSALLSDASFLHRTDQQFRWQNNSYTEFDDFLADLSSAKRKNLRKERAKAQDGVIFHHVTGDDITEAHLDRFFHFYMDTGARKWGTPYLNRESFSLLRQRLSEHILFVFAEIDGDIIAGAMNMIGSDTLYGRYWGSVIHRPMLHFETCYYQAIDYAIAHDLKFVEAGAQGQHKLARGYVPTKTRSAHWIAHSGLRGAVQTYLEHERDAVDSDIALLAKHTPFRKD
ncbi:MAG: GNAT family N-acetyltransferase [Hyphomonas sp.]